MRLNQFIAVSTGASRRGADDLIAGGKVTVNDAPATLGQKITDTDIVKIDGNVLARDTKKITIMLNKPIGYVCSRDGQGKQTIYELLPPELHVLKPVGRLDKDSSGLLLLTNDGELANKLTHPSFEKQKVYEIKLDKPLTEADFETITKAGLPLKDGTSKLGLDSVNDQDFEWKITMSEGRNRQIRRTFGALGYTVLTIHRTTFGDYELTDLSLSKYKTL